MYNTFVNGNFKWNKTPDGTDIGNYRIDGYTYLLNSDGNALVDSDGNEFETITEIEREMIFGTNCDDAYWLASRGADMDEIDAGVSYGLGCVIEGCASSNRFGLFHNYGMAGWGNDNGYYMLYLRPVVYCNKSKLPTKK